MDIDAITFDFYETLARHRDGRGRGNRLMAYLAAQRLESDPWEHQVLYDVFQPHAREYSPAHPAELRRAYLDRLAMRVFDRLNVRARRESATEHAAALWELLGPASLELFPEVTAVLDRVKRLGLGTAVVSNWQCGLEHFCVELGIGDRLDHVIASAELGVAKPDPAIFHEACRRLGTPPARTLHVGDTLVDDLDGARRAGLRAVLIRRDGTESAGEPALRNLTEVLDLPGLA